jgi:predicted Zn-dependent protease
LLAHQPEKAIAVLQRQLDLGNVSRSLYKLLAQAKGDMGYKSESHRWLAEYYYVAGRLRAAADQLRLAAEFAHRDEYQLAKITARLRDVELSLQQMEDR